MNMVEKKPTHLKIRFQKDFKCYEDYKKLKKEIITKGYTREVKANPLGGRTLYLPHHGVYHPHKPPKKRVLFNWSDELNGRLINNKILQIPDL